VSQTDPTTWKIVGTGGTAVNGSQKAFFATGVSGSIVILMNEGNDTVQVLNGDINAGFDLGGGPGNDSLSVCNFNSTVDMSINGGDGRNAVTLKNVTNTAHVTVVGLDHNDTFTFNTVHIFGLDMNGGDGTNVVCFNNATIDTGLFNFGGSGPDSF